MPLRSEAQRRYLHMYHPEVAERWEAHTTKKQKAKLPMHVSDKKVNKARLPGETPQQTYQRHQHQLAAGVSSLAMIPAAMAMKSGLRATEAMKAGDKMAQAAHQGAQLRRAAMAPAVGGLGAGINALPTPRYPEKTERRIKTAAGAVRGRARTLSTKPPSRPNPPSKYTRTGISMRDTSERRRDGIGTIVDDEPAVQSLNKALPPPSKRPKQPASGGRLATGGLFPGIHGVAAGRPGHKTRAAATELGGMAAGSVAGSLVGGRLAGRPGAAVGADLGSLGGAMFGTHVAHRQGLYTPTPTKPVQMRKQDGTDIGGGRQYTPWRSYRSQGMAFAGPQSRKTTNRAYRRQAIPRSAAAFGGLAGAGAAIGAATHKPGAAELGAGLGSLASIPVSTHFENKARRQVAAAGVRSGAIKTSVPKQQISRLTQTQKPQVASKAEGHEDAFGVARPDLVAKAGAGGLLGGLPKLAGRAGKVLSTPAGAATAAGGAALAGGGAAMYRARQRPKRQPNLPNVSVGHMP